MNKTMSRIFALLLALVMCIAVSATAFADDMPVVTGGSGSVTIKDTMTLDDGASVPNKTFTFTLAAATPSEGETYTAPDYAGIMTGIDTTYTASFAGVTATSGKATAEFTIDFTKVNFTEMGVYHYTLTGDATLSAPYSYTSDTEDGVRYIDVYVVYDETDPANVHLAIGGIYMYTLVTGEEGEEPNVTTAKSEGFEIEYTTYNLDLEKKVTGNQGNRKEYFEFEIELTDVAVDGTYAITGTSGENSATQIVVSEGEGKATVYLKHGDKVTIENLPEGASYTITEKNATDYDTDIVNNGDDLENTKEASGDVDADVSVVYTNDRTGTIPTGILLTIAPFAALMVIGIAGVLFIVLKKRGEEK